MLKVGITGGIGSGKTLVCKIFSQLDVPVYNADDAAKRLTVSNSVIHQKYLELFGNQIYFDDGALNKILLSQLIFNDQTLLEKVNAIVHPVVVADFYEWSEKNKNFKYGLQEAAILFESGVYKNMDAIITVYAPEETRIKRILLREKTSEENIQARMSKQWSDEEKISRSQFVIDNSDGQFIIPQILKIHKRLKMDN